MIRALPVMHMIGGLAAVAGAIVLLRPALPRDLFGIAESEAATYALRIVGAMLLALGLFLAGFATTLSIVG